MNTIKFFFDILFTSSDIFPIYIELKAFIKHFLKIFFNIPAKWVEKNRYSDSKMI